MVTGGLALLILAGCNTTKPMTVKRIVYDAPTTAPIDTSDLEPIAFQRGVVGIRYGTTIAHFPGHLGLDLKLQGTLCNRRYQPPATLEWNSTSRELSGWGDQIGVTFHDILAGRGYNMAGDPNQLFDAGRDLRKARFTVGARIEEIAGNICEEHDGYYGMPLGRFSAEMYMRVHWELYDVVQGRSVSSYQTEGYFLHPNVTSNGVIETFIGAFGAATEALATNPAFAEAIRKGKSATIQQVSLPVGEKMVIPAIAKYRGSFQENSQAILNAAVVIRQGSGHGSGFVISKDGLIITNAHVVGDAKEVVVRMRTGFEITGTVLRKHEERDIALVKIPVGFPSPMALDLRDAQVPEQVFAIGAPIDADRFQSTVSSGVVSAVRYKNSAGFLDIQADVDIHAGNSGGPLLDGKGNVIGVSYAGTGTNEFSTGLNWFIPIGQALESINLQLGPEAK